MLLKRKCALLLTHLITCRLSSELIHGVPAALVRRAALSQAGVQVENADASLNLVRDCNC